ncbi:transketolase, pyrimidine binding domain protein [Clostridioides difficile DA00165]|nr:transketolase, pyrimidine binding domain protein [Clostridioides difficile DA00165]
MVQQQVLLLVETFCEYFCNICSRKSRNSVAYPNLNVKIAATHAGVTVGEDGGSHQAIEDISLMRGIPNMVVLADALEARQAILASIDYNGPVYIRLGRAATPDVNSENYKFEIGKGTVLREGSDITVIATGIMVAKALEAAEELAKEGINVEVVNISTIKPLDEALMLLRKLEK